MARKRNKPEEIVAKLRQVDVLVSQGQNMVDAIRQIGVSEVTYYRWRQEFGGLKPLPVGFEPAYSWCCGRTSPLPAGCEQLILGSGQMGNVHLSPVAEAYFAKKGCKVLLQPTPEAIGVFNRHTNDEDANGVLRLRRCRRRKRRLRSRQSSDRLRSPSRSPVGGGRP